MTSGNVDRPTAPSARGTAGRLARALIGGFALTLLGLAAAAEDLPFGQPTVAYSGITVTEVGGQSIQTRVYFTPGHQRNEMDTAVGQQVMLMDFADKVSYMLMPMAKSYMEMPMGVQAATGAAPAEAPAGKVEHEVLGQETVGGQETTKYHFRVTTSEGSTDGFAWVTADGILMRSEAETSTGAADQSPGRIVMTLQDLSIGPQDPALFELPADYTKIGTN
jgi:hypothetical protein